MQVERLISYIEETANPGHAATWDISGVHVSGERQCIERVAVALDPIEETIVRALEWDAHFILTHHPLTLAPKIPSGDDLYTRILRLLFRSDVWLYCAHTSLDRNLSGPVSWFSRSIGLEDTHPLDPISPGDREYGFGIIGDLAVPLEGEVFVRRVLEIVGRERCLGVGEVPEQVSRVAYCAGSGMELGGRAFEMGAQVFISGDIKYHLARDMELAGFVMDVGHFSLEEKMMEVWAKQITRDLKGEGIEVRFFPGRDPLAIIERDTTG